MNVEVPTLVLRRARLNNVSPLALAMLYKDVRRAKWLMDNGADPLTRYNIVPWKKLGSYGAIKRNAGYVRVQNEIDEYLNPGCVYGRPSDPSFPEENFFWNYRPIEDICIEELTVALDVVFGFTELEKVKHKGRQKQPLIDKLNELRRAQLSEFSE